MTPVELRSFFRALTDDEAAPGSERQQCRLLRRIGADRLLGLGRPEAYGGRGPGPHEQFVFFDKAYRAGAPAPARPAG